MIDHLFASAMPSIWVTGGITVGLLVLLSYMIRVPHDYPLRGMVVALSALAFAASAAVFGKQLWDRSRQDIPEVKAQLKAAAQHEIEQQPVQPLDSYVPPMPGADSAIRHAQPSVGGLPSGTIWDETTNQSIAQVVRFYADDANHQGWQVEVSAPNGMVLRRTVSALGQLEDERLRIQAMPNPDVQGKRTEIEFALTRRLKN
jgi:hypothetical protein